MPTAPTTVYLARHGETDWNRAGVWQGGTDIPLNETGRSQAQALAESLRSCGIQCVYSSNLSRAEETARIVATELASPFASAFPEFRERTFGVFEGLTRAQVSARYPKEWAAYQEDRRNAPPGGEAQSALIARLKNGLERVAQPPGPLLVVTHGGCMRALLSLFGSGPVQPIQNGGVVEAVVEEGRLLDVRSLSQLHYVIL